MADLPFALADAVDRLRRTPAVLTALLADLPDAWGRADEGPDTWTPADVVGHLIHGEVDDWIPRTVHIRTHGTDVPFPAFDPAARHAVVGDADLPALLDRFATLRASSIATLEAMDLQPADLDATAVHPAFGTVTLRMHLACWTVHDMDHLRQALRAMALGYAEEVGPWTAYLGVLAG